VDQRVLYTTSIIIIIIIIKAVAHHSHLPWLHLVACLFVCFLLLDSLVRVHYGSKQEEGGNYDNNIKETDKTRTDKNDSGVITRGTRHTYCISLDPAVIIRHSRGLFFTIWAWKIERKNSGKRWRPRRNRIVQL
jgi:hypothetical protein